MLRDKTTRGRPFAAKALVEAVNFYPGKPSQHSSRRGERGFKVFSTRFAPATGGEFIFIFPPEARDKAGPGLAPKTFPNNYSHG
jgi:hypothetical protein